MSIVTRNTKGGQVYWVVFRFQGRQLWERVGRNRREAERRDLQRKRELAAGTYDPTETQASLTVRQYAHVWLGQRTNKTAKDDRQRITDHVLSRDWFASMLLDEVRARHMRKLVEELQQSLGWKTAKNTYGAVRTMFRRAAADELISKDPCDHLGRVFEDGARRQDERDPYTPSEAGLLVYDERIGWDVRVLNALAIYTGMRAGEVCGRRWRDLDRGTEPLWCLSVDTQYDGEDLKTRRPRRVPVHTDLQAILERWEDEGFELLTQRKPEPNDFIVPNVSPWAQSAHHTKSTCYKRFAAACRKLGIECRTLHSTRHTFITWARRHGADVGDLEAITHNARGTIVDGYTHRQWGPLCDAVSKFSVEPPPGVDSHPLCSRERRNAEECSGTPGQLDSASCRGNTRSEPRAAGSIPGASTAFREVFASKSTPDQQPNGCLTGTKGNRRHWTPGLFALASTAHRLGLLDSEVAA